MAVVLTSAVTAAYATRAYLVLTAHVRERPDPGRVSPAVLGVLWALVGGTVFGGLVLLTGAFRVDEVSVWWLLLTVLAIAVGVVLALRGGFDRDPADVLARRFVPHADRGLGADALYHRVVARPVVRLARLVAFVDTEVVDAYVRGTAVATRVAGWTGGRLHGGERPSSAVGLVVGAVVVLGALAVAGVAAWS